MISEEPDRGGLSSHNPRQRPGSSAEPSHPSAAGGRTPGPQQPVYPTAAPKLMPDSIPPFSMGRTDSRAASHETQDSQSSSNPFHTSVRRLQQMVDQRSPEKRSHTVPVRHSARTRLANLTSPHGGGVSKSHNRPTSNTSARQEMRAAYSSQPALSSPIFPSEPMLRSQSPEEHAELKSIANARKSSKEPPNSQNGATSAVKPSVQGMTPLSSPPHPASNFQTQRPPSSSIFPQHPALGANSSSPFSSGNRPGIKGDVSAVIQRMIAYTRAVESLRSTKDDAPHVPLPRHPPELHAPVPQADLAYSDTLAPSPILSDMPAAGPNTRPRIRMHTDLNALRMNPGSRPGAVRKQLAWGFDNRPTAFASSMPSSGAPSTSAPAHAAPSNPMHLNAMPSHTIPSNASSNTMASNTMPFSYQQRPKTFVHSRSSSTESAVPRDRSHVATTFQSPSTPVAAPYSTPREAPSEPSAVSRQAGFSQKVNLNIDDGQKHGGPKSVPKATVQSTAQIPTNEIMKKDADSRLVYRYERRPWTERDWRQFSLAMRESISSHNVKPDELVALFRDMRICLPQDMQEMPLGEVERRLAVWLNSTKKFRKS